MTGTTLVAGEMQTRLFTEVGHRKVMNDLNRNTMETIRDEFWPFHFTTAAYKRYPGVYAARTKKYQMYKARVVHHQRPNEFSGDLRRAVLLDSKVYATFQQGRLVAKAPLETRILFGPRQGQVIRRPLTEQRRKELEFVSVEEIEGLRQRLIAMYRAAVYDPAYQKIVLAKFR